MEDFDTPDWSKMILITEQECQAITHIERLEAEVQFEVALL